MKQYMKYVTALLFVLSLVILLFLPVITVASMDISMMDVLRLGGQAGSGSGVFAELLQSYLEPYFFGILLVLLVILAAAVLSAVLPWRYAYLEALIGAIAANLAVIIFVAGGKGAGFSGAGRGGDLCFREEGAGGFGGNLLYQRVWRVLCNTGEKGSVLSGKRAAPGRRTPLLSEAWNQNLCGRETYDL